MKILFANPPWWESSKDYVQPTGKIKNFWTKGVRAGSRWPHTNIVWSSPDNYRFKDQLNYPYFLGMAASYARSKLDSCEIFFRDSIGLSDSYKTFYKYIFENKFDVILIETASSAWEHDKIIINEIKKILPNCKIVLSGPIYTKGNKIFDDAPVTTILKGEYEKNFVNTINNNLEGFVEFDFLSKDEMNNFEHQYNDLEHAYIYFEDFPKARVAQLHMLTSRGCPYKCIFCAWPAVMTSSDPDGKNKRTVRQYSKEHLDNFISKSLKEYNYNHIVFDDDTFNLGDRHVNNVCEIMREKSITWHAMCRADTISKETWKIMKDSGCVGVKIGFESGNQDVIDNIVKKDLNLEEARETTKYIKSLDLKVHGFFTYGLPGETDEQMKDTKKYLKSLELDAYQESGTAVLDGTPLETLNKEKKLEKYSKAEINDSYKINRDGNKKMKEIQENLS